MPRSGRRWCGGDSDQGGGGGDSDQGGGGGGVISNFLGSKPNALCRDLK
jgi:hypothetical protein